MDTHHEHNGGQESPPPEAAEDKPASWVEIENGRYQPRRIRGSCLGRELG